MVTRVITKATAGEQDVLWGIGTTNQTRNGISYPIKRVDKIHPVDTMADLILLDMSDPNLFFGKVYLLGFSSIGDNEGGMFYFKSDEPHTNHNGYTIIQATGTSVNGCWMKFLPLQSTSIYLDDIGADINTTNKFEGKQIWDASNKQPIWARGSAPGDLWVDGTGATVHTPV